MSRAMSPTKYNNYHQNLVIAIMSVNFGLCVFLELLHSSAGRKGYKTLREIQNPLTHTRTFTGSEATFFLLVPRIGSVASLLP